MEWGEQGEGWLNASLAAPLEQSRHPRLAQQARIVLGLLHSLFVAMIMVPTASGATASWMWASIVPTTIASVVVTTTAAIQIVVVVVGVVVGIGLIRIVRGYGSGAAAVAAVTLISQTTPDTAIVVVASSHCRRGLLILTWNADSSRRPPLGSLASSVPRCISFVVISIAVIVFVVVFVVDWLPTIVGPWIVIVAVVGIIRMTTSMPRRTVVVESSSWRAIAGWLEIVGVGSATRHDRAVASIGREKPWCPKRSWRRQASGGIQRR